MNHFLVVMSAPFWNTCSLHFHSLATTLSSSQRQCKISCPTPPQCVGLRMKKQQLQCTTHISDFSYLVLCSVLPPVKGTAKHVQLTIIHVCSHYSLSLWGRLMSYVPQYVRSHRSVLHRDQTCPLCWRILGVWNWDQ